jgi:predicted metal-dependent hydrolase
VKAVLVVGKTQIPYVIRHSQQARRKRIVVTPAGVEVIAPSGTPLEGVTAFVHSKRRWMFDAVREIDAKQAKMLTQRYASGAKLQYRGRWLMLDIQSAEVDSVQIACRSKIHIQVPQQLDSGQRLSAIQTALDVWLKQRAESDLQLFTRRHAARLAIQPTAARLTEAKFTWGTCGKDGVIRVHWRLVQAPRLAMEYVVAHEIAHLHHRNHSPNFWKKLAEAMPNWAQAKALLERWETEHRAV